MKLLKKIFLGAKRFIVRTFFYIFRLFSIKKNKIVVSNYYGNGYGDNAKYVVEKILDKEIDYDVVWLCNNMDSDMPNSIRKVKYRSIKAVWELATAKIWLDNCRKPYYFIKRKKQYYIQFWHGGIALKQIEKDAKDKIDNSYIKSAKHDSKMANLFVSNSGFCTNMYKKSFWYNGEIVESGSPRCDILIKSNELIEKKVKNYFDLNKEDKILLYAPTFRKDNNTDVYNIKFNKLINVLEKKYNSKWKILVRLHPNIQSKSDFIDYDSKIIDATDYDDMYELMSMSDILISDYSSTIFEFSFTYKPVFLYATDVEKYKNDRNFYFKIDKLPYPLAESNKELFSKIKKFNYRKYKKNLNVLFSDLEIIEKGNASEKIAKKIINIINK